MTNQGIENIVVFYKSIKWQLFHVVRGGKERKEEKKGRKRREEREEKKREREERREKGRKRKGKEGKGEYEDSVGGAGDDFFFKVQRSVKNSDVSPSFW
jgi:hypothetical protein